MNTIGDTLTISAPFSDMVVGGWDGLQVGNQNERLTLMRFDTSNLSSLSGVASIDSVKLIMTSRVFVGGPTYTFGLPQTIEVRQVSLANQDWVEGTDAWVESVPGATFNSKDNGSAQWASGTAISWDSDNFGDTVGSIQIQGMSVTDNVTQFEFSLDPSLIGDWLADAGLAMAGIALVSIDATTSNEVMGFWSREAAEAGYRPYLSVEFTPVPEPGSYALISSFAVLALLCMRKRRGNR